MTFFSCRVFAKLWSHPLAFSCRVSRMAWLVAWLPSLMITSIWVVSAWSDEPKAAVVQSVQLRREWDLTQLPPGAWHVRSLPTAGNEEDHESPWLPAQVPATNEFHLADDHMHWDGTAEYRLVLDLNALPGLNRGKSVSTFLQFDAVATDCVVEIVEASNSRTPVRKRLGSHLGGWTPFRIDLTDSVQHGDSDRIELRILVDEKLGHNTQGFLPIIEPHFGGIWLPVKLMQIPLPSMDDLQVGVQGIWSDGSPVWLLDLPRSFVDQLDRSDEILFRFRRRGTASWRPASRVTDLPSVRLDTSDVRFELRLAKDAVEAWRPDSPVLYEYQLLWNHKPNGQASEPDRSPLWDQIEGRSGFRHVEVRGRRLLFNGRPLTVRGVLNWGYDPERLGPTTSEAQMIAELKLVQEWGFNLVKFCLWVPPQRFLDLADEMGVMVWIEYPTWHPQLTQKYRGELKQEYAEFFRLDRRHPSIVLRSLTCETGRGADEEVLRSLYDLGKTYVPGAVIEDDSSWIEWNRIHDFYDDHPYGNNHTWPSTVKRLLAYIDEREPKPLILGEAIAADTFYEPDPKRLASAPRPLALPGFAEANVRFQERIRTLLGRGPAKALTADSLRYAWLMRKYQIETFRMLASQDGYVVSVIRDFPLAGMGLIDYDGKPKWSAHDWNWHRSTILILKTPEDRRSWVAGSDLPASVKIVHDDSRPLPPCRLIVEWPTEDGEKSVSFPITSLEPGTTHSITIPEFRSLAGNEPKQFTISAQLLSELDGTSISENHWDIWSIPKVRTDGPVPQHIVAHSSWDLAIPMLAPGGRPVMLARKIDGGVLKHVQEQGPVLMVPDGGKGSFAQQSHWFLRGGPVIADKIPGPIPRRLWVDLQHFDLAGAVVPRWTDWDAVEPWLMLWDNHDIKEVLTHSLVFEMPLGQHSMLVSSLNHAGPTNAAGRWLLDEFATYLQHRDATIDKSDKSDKSDNRARESWIRRGEENLRRLYSESTRQEINLADRTWKFRTDPKEEGKTEQWYSSLWDDHDWTDLRIDQHWDGQGYEHFDGWAWYRTQVTIPEDWQAETSYLSFTGVDDHYLAYVNGDFIGSGGEIATKTTAFEARASHQITKHVRPGATIAIAIGVFDWYGAGGIFRPVSITSHPLSNRNPWLR